MEPEREIKRSEIPGVLTREKSRQERGQRPSGIILPCERWERELGEGEKVKILPKTEVIEANK